MNISEYETDLEDRIISSMKRNGLDDCAYSVFLTGSLGRGEATYAYNDGDVTLMSDVEIGIVYRNRRKAAAMVSAVSAQFDEELNCMLFSKKRMLRLDNFNNAVFPQKKKTLFMFDLVKANKHIYGTNYIDNVAINVSDIDVYEAKRLVANRIGELIFNERHSPDSVRRWEAKLVCAIGSAYLLCEGKYRCSYHDQMEEMSACQGSADKLLGDGFLLKYAESFSYLRQNYEDFSVDREMLEGYVERINGFFKEKDIKGPKVNTLSRKLKYMLKCLFKARKINFIGIEEKLIDSLIEEFISNNDNISVTAELWRDILY